MTSRTLPLPPGNMELPFLGETLEFLRDPLFARKRHDCYGDIFKTNVLGQPTIFFRGAEATRWVLTQEHQTFKSTWPKSVATLLGAASLATQQGDIHLNRRKLMAQAFQPRALSSYVPAIAAITDCYCQKWQAQGEFAWYPELRHYTFDVAAKLLIGFENGAQHRLCDWFEMWSQGLFTIPIAFPWTPFGKALKAREWLLMELETLIRQRQEQSSLGTDALGMLLQAKDEHGKGLSLQELKEQVLLLLFAGHETLTSSLTSLVMLLAQHPTVQDKARAEQAQFQGQVLTAETLKAMTYLDQVTQETLRFIPPVAGGFRQVTQEALYQGYQIPAGWLVNYQISATHHDERHFPEPGRFDPDRFEPNSQRSRPPFAHVPFGGGVRECIGKEFARLEMKILGAKLLQGFQWEIVPHQDLTLMVIPSPRPKDGLRVRFSSVK